MLNYKSIKIIRSEHTSRCNLRCPECARIYLGKRNKNINLGDITAQDYERIIVPELRNQIENVILSGCYGDAAASPTLLSSIEFLKSIGIKSQLQTNGSLRSVDWWKMLAELFGKTDEPSVSFAIDGINNKTNIINRVCSDFDKIIRNARAFIESGGVARWDFVEFDYNAHQIEAAKQMAKDIGFKMFISRRSFNHVNNVHFLESFHENNYKGKNKHFKKLLEKYGSMINYINSTKIDCKILKERSIYIDYDLNLWPCCWIGGPYFTASKTHIQKDQLNNLENKYGKGFNSLRTKSIKEIFNHPWFQTEIEKGWNNKFDDKIPKLFHCVKACGEFYKPSTTEDCNREVTVFF